MRKATYKQSLVTYVDILGFKDAIETESRLPEQLQNDLKFAQVVGKIAIGTFPSLQKFRFKAFSDSVSMSAPMEEGSLTSFFLHLVQFQAQLVSRGVFVRGAVTYGKHFEDKDVMFGQALIRAVELEKQIALWPRIIVDPEVLLLARRFNIRLDMPLKGDLVALLRSDYDGIHYVNYFGHFLQSPQWHGSSQESEQFARKHRDYITKQLETTKSRLGVFAKYHWLSAYHNSVVTEQGWGDLDINYKVPISLE